MRNWKRSITEMLILLTIASVAPAQQSGHATAAQPAPVKHQSASRAARFASEGERVFAQNCSRCHTAPDGFSPRISGTIAMHMRVRASLSEHDMRELLRFLNP